MSNDRHGMVALVAEAAAATAARLDMRADELRQLELEDPITGEELLEAKVALGAGAGRLAVLAKARENRRGRPAGSRNRSTEDLRRYLLQFGTDPLVGAMRMQSERPEVLAELWGCEVKEVIDRQLRSRELLAPYMHGKKPVAVDISFSNVADLVITGVTHSEAEVEGFLEGDFLDVTDAKDAAVANDDGPMAA